MQGRQLRSFWNPPHISALNYWIDWNQIGSVCNSFHQLKLYKYKLSKDTLNFILMGYIFLIIVGLSLFLYTKIIIYIIIIYKAETVVRTCQNEYNSVSF